MEDSIDILLAALVVWWQILYVNWSSQESPDPQMASNPEAVFIFLSFLKKESGEFHFDILLASITSLFLFRFIRMLRLTRMFGPMISMVEKMVYDLGTFLIIWVIQLFTLSAIAVLVFGELDAYKKPVDALLIMFETAMGNWDLSIYDDLHIGPIYGKIFHIFAIILNLIVLVNLVIAILADTYSFLASRSLGLYYDGVISRIPAYKFDNKYGGLIFIAPPFNLLVLPLVPFYLLIENEVTLKSFNIIVCKILFVPYATIYTCVFIVFNLVMAPFGYLVAIFNKFKMLCSSRVMKAFKRSTGTLVVDLLVFTICGPVMLLCSQVTDLFYFVLHLYSWKLKKLNDQGKICLITIEDLIVVETVTKAELARLYKENGGVDLSVPVAKFVVQVRDKMDVPMALTNLVFGPHVSLKELPDPLEKIKRYNLIKKVLSRQSYKSEEGAKPSLNLKLLEYHLKELRVKIDCTMIGLMSDKKIKGGKQSLPTFEDDERDDPEI